MSTTTKINATALAYIQLAVKTAEVAKINMLIIEPGRVRAIDDANTVVILQTKDVPAMPFGSIGLNRLDIFSSRLEVAKTAVNFEAEATVEEVTNKETNESQQFARSLTFKGKGITVDYRCANPMLMKAPKNMNDLPTFKIRLTTGAVLMLSKGHDAMHGEDVALIGSKEGVEMQMFDGNGDVFKYTVADSFEVIAGKQQEFNYKYPIKTLLPLFKLVPETSIFLTSRGMLKLEIKGFDMYIPPRIQ